MKYYQYLYYRLVLWMEKLNSAPASSALMIISIFTYFNVGASIILLKYGLGINIHFSSRLMPAIINIALYLVNFFCLEDKVQQIEAIYAIDCQPATLFAQNGESLFFSALSYEQTTQRIFYGNTRQENESLPFNQGEVKAGKGVHRLDGIRVETLSDSIAQFHLSTGRLPQWKTAVRKQLATLSEQILHRPLPHK